MSGLFRSTRNSFIIFFVSGIALISSAGVVIALILPNIGAFFGVTLARVVATCNTFLTNITGQDVLRSSTASVGVLMSGVFLLSTVIIAVVMLYRNARYVRRLDAHRVEVGVRLHRASLGFPGMSIVQVDDEAPLVMTTGWIHPRVYVSTGMVRLLTAVELRSVLYHESYHCARRDHLRLWVVQIFQRILWFVPGVRAVARHIQSLIELSADEYAIRMIGDDRPIGTALVKAIRYQGRASVPPGVAAFSLIDDRIDRMLNRELVPRTRAVFLVPIFILCVISGSLLITSSMLAAPQVVIDDRGSSTQSVCPQFVPQLLMSVPGNTVCTSADSGAPACAEIQSRSR